MFKKVMLSVILSVVMLAALGVYAHEGHDTPGAFKANHGGVVKAGKEINIEYVVSGAEVKIYPVSHEGKDLTAGEVKLEATAKTSKGKPETVKFEFKNDAFVTMVDFKGTYRVEMLVTTVANGKKDTFKFQVEK